jgi:hypothetical protein
MNRRAFLVSSASLGAALRQTRTSAPQHSGTSALSSALQHSSTSAHQVRSAWLTTLQKLAEPVLMNLAAGTLKARMPVEEASGANRKGVTHLEAFGRLVAGIAPWLDLDDGDEAEQRLRARCRQLTTAALAQALDPRSPDALNFTEGGQPLVDAAFLAQGLLRAPRLLHEQLDRTTRARLIGAFESARVIQPGFNNWLLFAATVEAALKVLGARWDRMRVDYALRQHEQWYRGDGAYSDGPAFHWDYYNSFVIHPMLIDVLSVCGEVSPAWTTLRTKEEARATRYAAVLERLIAPDGSFPPIGRSIAYRCGAFHALAQAALRHALPPEISPPQVRSALTAVIERSLTAAQTFDASGWLTIGFAGHQPGVGERYISTGSLYLCSMALLPLGLAPADPFWSAAAEPWTSKRAWAGEVFPIDKALVDG